ncbi:hypothetical protein [Flavitalea sp.]|nr:hypothetical protein [Flavitalea sp.]
MPKITIDTDLIDSKIAQLNLEIERLQHIKEVLPDMILDTVISSQKKPLASEFITQFLKDAPSGASSEQLADQYAVISGKSKFEIKSLISNTLSRMKSAGKIEVSAKSAEGWEIYELVKLP